MILYAAVARLRDAEVLVQVSEPSWKGNAGQVATILLQHMRDNPESIVEGERRTFLHRNDAENDFFYHLIEACSVALGDSAVDEHFFHVYRKDSVLYCCLGDDPDLRDHTVHFAFLEHLQQEFTKMYGPRKIDTARGRSLEKNFGPCIRSAIHHHNIHHDELRSDQKVQKLRARVEDFKAVMGRNIQLMMENTISASGLLKMSDETTQDAQVFKRRSKALLKQQKQRHFFTVAMGVGVCLVVVLMLLFTLWGMCGFRLQHCRASSDEQEDEDSGESDYSGERNLRSLLQLLHK